MAYKNVEDRRAYARKRWHEKKASRKVVRFPTPEEIARRSLDWKAIGQAYKEVEHE